MAWAPYFMAAQSPEAARRTLHRLIEGHMTEQQRGHTTTGDVDARGMYAVRAHRCESPPQQVAHDMGGSPSRTGSGMARWATRRLAPFLTVPVVAPPPAAPAIVPPVGAGGAMPPFGRRGLWSPRTRHGNKGV
ncbi:hypothetical protein MHU86_19122 [Fragilaria crotonensis]|nr:hypothetical protein MHU86_19122 [Fragilaria crotonensis]